MNLCKIWSIKLAFNDRITTISVKTGGGCLHKTSVTKIMQSCCANLPELQAYVDAFEQKYGTSYGALHARVEMDMRKAMEKRGPNGAKVLDLATILKIMNSSTLEQVDVLFVALGDDLLPGDREIVQRDVMTLVGRIR